MVAPRITPQNRGIYIIVVIMLGLITLGSLGTTAILSFEGRTIPDSITNLGFVALGALGSLFSNHS